MAMCRSWILCTVALCEVLIIRLSKSYVQEQVLMLFSNFLQMLANISLNFPKFLLRKSKLRSEKFNCMNKRTLTKVLVHTAKSYFKNFSLRIFDRNWTSCIFSRIPSLPPWRAVASTPFRKCEFCWGLGWG